MEKNAPWRWIRRPSFETLSEKVVEKTDDQSCLYRSTFDLWAR